MSYGSLTYGSTYGLGEEPSPEITVGGSEPDDTLSLYVEEPSGLRRIASDEKETLRDFSLSSTLPAREPGGFATFDAEIVLPGHPIPPHRAFSRYSLRHADGTIATEGRLLAQPERSDEGILTLSGVGHAAALRDDPSVVFLGVCADMTTWEEPPAAYIEGVLGLATPGIVQEECSFQASEGGISGKIATDRQVLPKHEGVLWFSAPAGQKIARTEYLAQTFAWGDIEARLRRTDTVDASVGGTHVIANGTEALTFTTVDWATAQRYVYLMITPTATINKTVQSLLRVHRIAHFGDHGLPRHSLGANLPDGLLYSDVIEHLVGLHAPGLAVEATPSQAVAQNIYYPEPVDVGQVIEEAMQFEADRRAAVFEGPTLHYKRRQDFGRTWTVRTDEGARFVNVGPTSEPEHDACVVYFIDLDGVPRTAGPPGSGADIEDASLKDDDSSNPVNAAGLYRPLPVEVPEPVSQSKAIELGKIALSEALRSRFSGEVELPRYHERESERVPTTMLRAGDWVVDGSATDGEPMQLIEASYARDSERPAHGTVDTPANRLDAALAGLGVRVRPLRRKRILKRARRRRKRYRRQRERARNQRQRERR